MGVPSQKNFTPGERHSRLLDRGMLVRRVDTKPKNIRKKSGTQKYQEIFQNYFLDTICLPHD